MRRIFAAVVLALSFAPAASAGVDKAEALFVPAGSASRDGALSDDVWQIAPPMTRFVQREPHEGVDPTERTEFRVAYDSTTLFVKVHAFDREPEKIVSYLTRRDDDSPCDWIRIFIDSFHDLRTAYEFAVNPSGVKQDRYWYNDTNSDMSWDAVWSVTVSRDSTGWSAEFRIPFSQLRFVRANSNTFGFAVAREIGRLKETSTWPLLARSANGYVSSFGELTGLSIAAVPNRLELVPYTVANIETQPTRGNPLQAPSSLGAKGGLDMRYALTPGLVLTATVNPDFGQVEADPAVVNLSAFETFFAERRPFFVEGSGNFRFDADCYDGCNGLFYSRRIGRAPQGTDNLPTGDSVFSDAPPQTTILGAAKLTGRIGRYAIGVMHADTQAESAVVLKGTVRSSQPVEPFTGYSVARVRREFANQSSVGFIATATNRKRAEGLSFLPDHEYVGGVDFDWRLLTRYSLTGFWEASRVGGTADAIDRIQENSRHGFQRPDLRSLRLDPTRTALSGDSAAIALSKIGGEHVRFNTALSFRSPEFDTNELGFQRRADQRASNNWLQIRSDKPSRLFRNRSINFNYWHLWNYDGDRLQGGWNINGGVTFINNWSIGGGYGGQQRDFDDRVTRGGPGVYMNGFWERWITLNSDSRRKLALNFVYDEGRDPFDSGWRFVQPGVTLRPIPALMVSVGATLNTTVQDSQWVANVADASHHYVFGHLDQTTLSFNGRLNFTMTPNLSLQLYAEPFLSAGDYSAFKELVDGHNLDYSARYAPYAYSSSNPDFNVKSFRTTNVLRWEYKPGSTLFVVWQQARENDAVPGGFRFRRDARDIFGVPPHNTFLVKLAYWISY